MTPLAHFVMKQKTLPLKRRMQLYDPDAWFDRLDDFHCFEISNIVPLIREIVESVSDRINQPSSPKKEDAVMQMCDGMVFLPAPKTWVEYRNGRDRLATLLIDNFDGSADLVDINTRHDALSLWTVARISTTEARVEGRIMPNSLTHIALAMINTPRVIGRRQHMPHRGLQRDLSRKLGIGKFPLHAWTEIELKVTKPIEIDDGEPHEAHLTGMRALHFCRAHLRIRLGKLEFVTSHWRGDPAIGIKQSRYKVTA